MDRRLAPLKTILRKIENSTERSPLFHWMCQHHDDLQKAARGRRLQWVSLCADLAADGLTSADGKAITPVIASRTWAKVRLEVARLRALERPRTEAARVRASATWQPPVISRPTFDHRPPQPKVANIASSSSSPSTGDEPVSLINKPKSEAQKIADIALTKHPQERTAAEKIAVAQAERERRSYS